MIRTEYDDVSKIDIGNLEHSSTGDDMFWREITVTFNDGTKAELTLWSDKESKLDIIRE